MAEAPTPEMLAINFYDYVQITLIYDSSLRRVVCVKSWANIE